MAGRFYYAPINPGYDRFGMAIAAGMQQGLANFRGQEERKTEEERYAAQQAQQKKAWDLQLMLAGRVPNQPAQPAPTAAPVRPIIGAFTPGAEGRVARTPAPQAEPTIAVAPVDVPMVPRLAPASTMSPVAAAYTAPPDSLMRGTVGGEEITIDPRRSMNFMTQRAVQEDARSTRKADEAEARSAIRTAISDALEDNNIDSNEWGLLSSLGVDPMKLQTAEMVAKEEEKAFANWEKKYNIEQEGRERIANINATREQRQLTAGQARKSVIDDVMGRAMELHDEGRSFAEIRDTLAPEYTTPAEGRETLGRGELYGLIDAAIQEKNTITWNRATAIAENNVLADGFVAGTPEFADAVIKETLRVTEVLRKEEAETRRRARTGEPDTRELDELSAATPAQAPIYATPPARSSVVADSMNAAPVAAVPTADFSGVRSGASMVPVESAMASAAPITMESLRAMVQRKQIDADSAVNLARQHGLIR